MMKQPLLPKAKESSLAKNVLLIVLLVACVLSFKSYFKESFLDAETPVGPRRRSPRGGGSSKGDTSGSPSSPTDAQQSSPPNLNQASSLPTLPTSEDATEVTRELEQKLQLDPSTLPQPFEMNDEYSPRDRGAKILKIKSSGKTSIVGLGEVLSPLPEEDPASLDMYGLPILKPEDRQALGPVTSGPKGMHSWNELIKFRQPSIGGKNLFLCWLGPLPPPIFYAFIHNTYINRGEFNMFLITDSNKMRYMAQEVNGKPICKEHMNPPDSHIAWKVCERVLQPWTLPLDIQMEFFSRNYKQSSKSAVNYLELPLATQKDFIVNLMVALFGGVHMDLGIIGPNRLDQWWELMHAQEVTYINYAFGAYREDPLTYDRQTRLVVFDKKGEGKWNGDLWIDSYFTMAPVDSCVMKCWLLLVANDPDWGPSTQQPNRSIYFIYGGDIYDSCFASCHDSRNFKRLQGFPYGVHLYPKRSSPIGQAPSMGSGSSSEQHVNVGRSLLAAEKQPMNQQEIDAKVKALADEMTGAFQEMFERMQAGSSSSSSTIKDPPNINGIPLPFSSQGNAIIIDARTGHAKVSSGMIRQHNYEHLWLPVWPDFETMISSQHPMAILVQEAIEALLSQDGTMYLKFYNTAGALRSHSWEILCGPPISLIMYLIKKVTGHDICTGVSANFMQFMIPVASEASAEIPRGETFHDFHDDSEHSERK